MPIKKSKFSFTLDLSEQIKRVKPSKRKAVTELIAITVLDSIENYTSRGVSPVSKGEYKKNLTNKEYMKKTGKKISDLHLSGSMLGGITFDNFKERITFKITDSLDKKKAFNHNTGDTLPTRKFMPDDAAGDKFKPSIRKAIEEIINDAS